MECRSRRNVKTFGGDVVHGTYDLSALCVSFIDTCEFQRLRNLKQLGLTHYVYQSANHTRLEHSLGVAHLAEEWAWQLLGRSVQDGSRGSTSGVVRPSEPEWRQDIQLVSLAGLLHDLGHGPFSHVFENELLPRVLGREAASQWHHERMSNVIFDYMVDSNHLDLQELTGTDAKTAQRMVRDLMTGVKPRPDNEKAWLYDIVANKTNGIDVDKMDYLKRDAYHTKMSLSLDVQRLMLKSKVHHHQIVFKYSEYEALYRGVFQDRATMHSRVYTHKKAKGIEFLVCDALALAAPELGLTADALTDVEQYMRLDDTILPRLQFLDPEASEQPRRVEQAQALVKRLQQRELYCYCYEFTVPVEVSRSGRFVRPSPEDLVQLQRSDGTARFSANDLVVCDTKVNFSMGDTNPLDRVLFYDLEDGVASLPQQTVSNLLANVYQDHKVRVFSKVRDPAIITSIRDAFRAWTDAFNRSQQFSSRIELYTPHKYRAPGGSGGQGMRSTSAMGVGHAAGLPRATPAATPGVTTAAAAAAAALGGWPGSRSSTPPAGAITGTTGTAGSSLSQQQDPAEALFSSQGTAARSCSSNGGPGSASGADSTASKKRQRSLIHSYPPPIAE